jgi:hypothetical protein
MFETVLLLMLKGVEKFHHERLKVKIKSVKAFIESYIITKIANMESADQLLQKKVALKASKHHR